MSINDDVLQAESDLQKSLEAEKSLVGSVLIDPEKLISVIEIASPEDFYNKILGRIYKTVMVLHFQMDGDFDMTLLLEKVYAAFLEISKGEIKVLLAEVMRYVPTSAHAVGYAQIVKQYSVIRQVKRLFSEVLENIFPEEAIAQAEKAAEKLIAITQSNAKERLLTIDEFIIPLYNSFFDRAKNTLLNTGFSHFDGILGGLEKGNLTIIAARPGTGKTAFALNLATKFIEQNKKVAFFSLEMSRDEALRRLFSMRSQVSMAALKQHDGAAYPRQLADAANWFMQIKDDLFIYDKSRVSVQEMRNLCVIKKGLDAVIIDYLGYMRPSKTFKNQNDAISEITGDLKAMAKDLGVPIICLAQLNRAVEGRSDSCPHLADLRDSGSIEQDANQVIFLFRESKSAQQDGAIGVNIAKNRDGKLGTVLMNFSGETQTFLELEQRYCPPGERKNDRRLQFD